MANDTMTIGFSPAELKRFRAQMKNLTEKKATMLKDVVNNSAYKILNDAQRETPRYTSALRSSLRVIRSSNGLAAKVWTNKRYAPYLEFGTKSFFSPDPELAQYAAQFRGGGDSGNFEDFVKSLKLWCKRKGIPEGAAYPIAVKLITKGQKKQPFLFPAFKAERVNFVKNIKRAMQ